MRSGPVRSACLQVFPFNFDVVREHYRPAFMEQSGPRFWVFSNNSTVCGSYHYDPRNDALRVSVSPQVAPHTEFLTYGFDERPPAIGSEDFSILQTQLRF